MSSRIIEEEFNRLITNVYDSDTRYTVETQKGQAIFLRNITGFKKAFAEFGLSINAYKAGLILQKGRDQALKLHNSYAKAKNSRADLLEKFLIDKNLVKPGELGIKVFIVANFDTSMKSIKTVMLEEAFRDREVEANIKEKITSRIHKGHGESGLAVSEVGIAQGLQTLKDVSGLSVTELGDLLEYAFSEYSGRVLVKQKRPIKNLVTKYSQIVTKDGKLSADYVSIVTFQYGKENVGRDAAAERALSQLFFKELAPIMTKRIVDMQGSSTLRQKVNASLMRAVIHELTTGASKGNVRIKGPDMVQVDLKTSGIATTKGTGKGSTGSTSKKKNPKPKITTTKTSLIDLKSLIPQLNAGLADQVARNMGQPALVNRTGRFASSARVVDIVRTPEGYPSISYTYQHNPYKLFEYPTGDPARASEDRDPRAIINQSIREKAVGIINGRFYTRRV